MIVQQPHSRSPVIETFILCPPSGYHYCRRENTAATISASVVPVLRCLSGYLVLGF
jgi:hypothetical protein